MNGIRPLGLIVLMMVFSLSSFFVYSQTSTPAWSHEIDGVTFEVDSDGEILRIFSKVSQPIAIPDRRGIRNAQLVAEERAKAAIIRFIEESVEDVTVVQSIADELQATLAMRSGLDGDLEFTSETARTASESIVRITRSHAEGQLRGVVRMSQGFDPDEEEAWVVVGISRDGMQHAEAARRFIGN